MVIRKGIEKAVKAAVEELQSIAKPIEGKAIHRTSCSDLFC